MEFKQLETKCSICCSKQTKNTSGMCDDCEIEYQIFLDEQSSILAE